MSVVWRILGLILYLPTVFAESDKQNWVGKINISPSIKMIVETPQTGYLSKQNNLSEPRNKRTQVGASPYRYQAYKFDDLTQVKKNIVDTDKDGIDDEQDKCSESPANALVTSQGCPAKSSQWLFNVYFNTGIYRIKKQQISILKPHQSKLKTLSSDQIILVTGFADSIGAQQRNIQLSWNRVQAVKNYLVKTLAVDKNKVLVVAMGEVMTQKTTQKTKDKLKNKLKQKTNKQSRRVEISIMDSVETPIKARFKMPDNMAGYTRYPVIP